MTKEHWKASEDFTKKGALWLGHRPLERYRRIGAACRVLARKSPPYHETSPFCLIPFHLTALFYDNASDF